jgi:hypothetical protein
LKFTTYNFQSEKVKLFCCQSSTLVKQFGRLLTNVDGKVLNGQMKMVDVFDIGVNIDDRVNKGYILLFESQSLFTEKKLLNKWKDVKEKHQEFVRDFY